MITSSPENIRDYYAQGAWDDKKIHDIFHKAVGLRPDATALVDPSNKNDLVGQPPRRLSFSELDNYVNQVAEVLLGQGLQQGDILLIQMPNTVELVALYLACSRIGCIISPVAMQYREHELGYIIATLQPKAIIGIGAFAGKDMMGHLQTALEQVNHQLERAPLLLPWFESADYPQCIEQLIEPNATSSLNNYLAEIEQSADEVFTICWTSGTEADPKGIPRSHNQWKAIGRMTFESSQIEPQENLLNPFPLINMAAIGGLFFSWLLCRGKLVLHHPLDLPVYLEQIAVEQISYTLAPPALLNALLKNEDLLKVVDLSGLRAIGSGSAPLDSWMVEGYKERFDIEIINHFGSNEGTSLLCGPAHSENPEARARLFPKKNSILESRLVNPETGELVNKPGMTGELQIKGPGVFNGYFGADGIQRQSFTDDGFFCTGDLFEMDKEQTGFYRFTGRCKELIIRGGMNIAPSELEALLNAHEHIAEAAVTGYPCPIMGERVAAYVVTAPEKPVTQDQVKGYLAGCQLAKYKLPEKVVFLSALPRNPVGKIVKRALAETD
ncbi:acyl--CoA ligase [Sansalvadorimonas sp. 2012CJ34-2]|uniref:Acyl--CoA ligase n=1 Tax=Parendozoicomonas callyspongiae TaxID=2942213 RepID=A0ABT0PKM9_9GAMM|nr:class I adenylate-forming enzyme family protein [Sansalvadorimonas sp. 2012CJ34-2]MCL6271923.1 acyl--CoA ligase [Sansalvadorimonas sp. 2012CJ34-2]